MADRTLRVEIVGDASSLQKTFGKAADSGDRLGRSFSTLAKVGAAAGVALAGGVALGLKTSIDAASNLTEQINKANVVFRGNQQQVFSWSKGLEQSFGLSQRAALEAAGTFGNMLVPMGIARGKAAKMSEAMVELGGDMASFNNADPTETLLAIRSGLAGETEPLRKFGVFLSAASVQTEALTETGKKNAKQLTEAEKVQARYNLILKQTGDTQGDFARSAGSSVANQMRILKASFEDVAASVGQVLLPVFTKFLGFVNTTALPTLGQVFGKISEVAGPAISKFGETFQNAIPVILGVVKPLAEEIGSRLIPIFQALQDIGGRAITAIGEVIKANGPQLRQIFENLGTVISNLAKIIIPILDIAFTKVLPVALRVLIPLLVLTTGALAKVSDVARVTAQIVTAVLTPVIRAIVPVVSAVATAFTTAWAKVSSAVKSAVAAVMPLINGIKAIITGMVDAVVGVLTGDWSRAWSGIKQVVTTAINGVKAYLQAVPGAILQLGVAIGQAIIHGIVSGFTGLLGQLKSSLESGLKSVVSSLNPFSPVEEGGAKYIGRPLAEGAIRGWIEGSAKLPTSMAEKIRSAVESARSAIQASEGILADAMGALASAMMSAFDKVTQEHMTKTEKTLLARQEALAKKQREQALSDANDALATAQGQLSAAQTPEEIDAANQAIAAAYEQQQQALYDIETAALEKKAEQERIAYDKKRERQRVALENELTAAQNAYNNGAITLEQYNQRVIAIMKKYGVPWKNAARTLGAQLAAGLHDAFADVQKAARALSQAIVKELSNIKVIVQVNLSSGKGNKDIPGRAIGGPVKRNMPYVVGEAGPELFIPSSSGYISPSAGSGSGVGGSMTIVELNFNGPTVGTSREFEDTVRRALYDVQRRNPGTGLATT